MAEAQPNPTPEPAATPPASPPGEPSPATPPATPPADPPAPDPAGAPEPEPAPAAAEPTLAEGGGKPEGDDEPQPTPATWPENWREILAGGDTKFLTRLNRFASPVNFGKSWLSGQQKITSGEMIRAKPDGEDVEALNEWRAQAGIPEKPEGYLENLPGGRVIGEEDKPLVDSFLADMHASDAPPEYVHKALGWYYAHEEEVLADRAEADKNGRAVAEDTLRADWGPEYRPNMNAADSLLTLHGSDELKEKLYSARMTDGTPLGDDPDLLRFLSAVSRDLNPHGVVVPTGGQSALQTIEAEIKQLETESGDTKGKKYDYWQNEGKQERLRELYRMQDTHKARIQ